MSLYNDLTTVLTPYANKIKQNESDIGDIQDELSTINESLGDVQGLQTGKADMSTVTALSDTVSGLQTAVQGKADAQTVTALSGTVSSLSDTTQQYMEYTNSAITDLQDNKASKSYVDGELATKANVQTVTALSGTVTDLQANKADKSYVDAELAGKASTAVATTSSDGLMSAQDKSRLDEVALLKEQIYNSYPNVEAETASVVSITDGADGIPVKSLVVSIDPVQAGSGDPSPDNVRPISGWTGVEVTVSPTTDAEDGDTYSITFPTEAGTVYGGTLDVTNGVLTVDMAIVDMGTLNWMYYSAKQRIVAKVNVGKPAVVNVGLDGACSVYKVVNTGYQSAPDKSIVIGNNFISNLYAAMVVHDEDYTDAETFKTAVSGQTLVFPIKTPVTYQLTPTEVTTLLGANNIWADTGDCAVEYRADTKKYIDGVYVDYRTMLAPVESTYTATRNYTTGQLLIVGDTLYKVTANIANGGTITVGTNVVATTLSEVILALA